VLEYPFNPPTQSRAQFWKGEIMGRGILLWLLGVPIPVIIILALVMR
jgi:hypothetical protein